MLLTSNGFENPHISLIFLNMIKIDPQNIKILFIPVAAEVDKESREILPECINELLRMGILESNIDIRNDIENITYIEIINKYNCIYMAGGDENHLINRINNSGFRNELLRAINNGIFYIGVSAGTCICTPYVSNSLNIIPNSTDVHCEKDVTPDGLLPINKNINLSAKQAILINGNDIRIIS